MRAIRERLRQLSHALAWDEPEAFRKRDPGSRFAREMRELVLTGRGMLRNADTRSGSGGASRVTVGLSSLGPPPTLMMIQLLARATIVGSPSSTSSPPSTSV